VAKIDSTARVADGAKLGADVEIGPYCIIGPNVTLGDGCRLVAHVSIVGDTSIGKGARILPFSSLGTPPQSVHYKGERARLIVGENCDMREHVTMNIGTAGGRMETRVGNDCMFMVGSHVGHDCVVGNNVIFANCGTLGGHAEVGDSVFIGGFGAVHQNARIGEGAMLAGLVAHRHDIIPYGITSPEGRLGGLNLIGLKRRNFSRQTIHTLRAAYRELFFGEGNLSDRTEMVAKKYDEPAVQKIAAFIRSAGKRRISTPRSRTRDGDEED
jgi:UDP-N-acetylglucosamine acyltransferase